MESLFEITLARIFSKPRRSLKRLSRHLRIEINREWFNQLPSTQDRVCDAIFDHGWSAKFTMELPKNETAHYVCQDCWGGCEFLHDRYLDLPSTHEGRGEWSKKGFIYSADRSHTLTILYGSSHENQYQDQNIIKAHLFPDRYRQLQACIIHLVRPRVSTGCLDIGAIEKCYDLWDRYKYPDTIGKDKIKFSWNHLPKSHDR